MSAVQIFIILMGLLLILWGGILLVRSIIKIAGRLPQQKLDQTARDAILHIIGACGIAGGLLVLGVYTWGRT